MSRIAIAACGKRGIGLTHQLNRTQPNGELRFGIMALVPQGCMTGHRFDVIIVTPPSIEATQRECAEYLQWCDEILPTKLRPDGEIILL